MTKVESEYERGHGRIYERVHPDTTPRRCGRVVGYRRGDLVGVFSLGTPNVGVIA